MDGRELRQYERWKEEVQLLRMENQHLRLELMALRPQAYRDDQKIDRLERRVEKLVGENKLLVQQVADLTARLKHKPKAAPPAFVKANAAEGSRRKKPGRRHGHAAALRPLPAVIDVHQDVPVPIDTAGKPSCPHCRTQPSEVRHHERIVEDIVPSKVITTCYHTTSGYCPWSIKGVVVAL